MFATHQPIIGTAMRASPSGLARGVVFVLATIQVKFPDAVRETQRYCTTGELHPMAFFGAKLRGVAWINQNAEKLFTDLRNADEPVGQAKLFKRLKLFREIPGIGITKAGFLCQLRDGTIGCLDVHNKKRFGIATRRYDHASDERTYEYIGECFKCGGPETLWNEWCELIGTKYGMPAEKISEMHLAAVGPYTHLTEAAIPPR